MLRHDSAPAQRSALGRKKQVRAAFRDRAKIVFTNRDEYSWLRNPEAHATDRAGFEGVMKALGQAEAIRWCRARKLDVDEGPPPRMTKDGLDVLRAELPKLAGKHFWFSGFLEGFIHPWHHCLLWVTTHGVWQSSENWHLYYRLRQSYGDLRLIRDAPAHLFEQTESHDLVSFIQIALGAGWDFYLLADPDHSRIFVSHDEFVDFFTRGDAELDDLRSDLSKAGIKLLNA